MFSRLITEDITTNIDCANLLTAHGKYILVFDIRIRVSEDEIISLVRETEAMPMKAPHIFRSSEDLIEAMSTGKYPTNNVTGRPIMFSDVRRFLMTYPLQFILSGGVDRDDANKILALVFNKTKEEELAKDPDEKRAIAVAKKVMTHIYNAWPHGKRFFGKDMRALQRAPGSSEQLRRVAPSLIKEILKKTRQQALGKVKKLFMTADGEGAEFPSAWRNFLDFNYRAIAQQDTKAPEIEVERAKPADLAKKAGAEIANKIRQMLGRATDPTTEQAAMDFITVYGEVVVDLGNPREGFLGELVGSLRQALRDQNYRIENGWYIWDTGIPGIGDWINSLQIMTTEYGATAEEKAEDEEVSDGQITHEALIEMLRHVMRSQRIATYLHNSSLKSTELQFDLAKMKARTQPPAPGSAQAGEVPPGASAQGAEQIPPRTPNPEPREEPIEPSEYEEEGDEEDFDDEENIDDDDQDDDDDT